eukprot:5434764-Amphidinium_carterae.1
MELENGFENLPDFDSQHRYRFGQSSDKNRARAAAYIEDRLQSVCLFYGCDTSGLRGCSVIATGLLQTSQLDSSSTSCPQQYAPSGSASPRRASLSNCAA